MERVVRLLLCATSAAVVFISPASASVVPNAYIVELESELHQSSFTSLLSSHPDATLSKATVHLNLSSDVFTGVSINTDASIDSVASIAGVLNVWPVQTIKLPDLPLRRPIPSPPSNRAPPVVTSNYSTHGMTGVDKLQAKGIKGSGVVVGIVDTGVDYLHPDLGGGIGPGKKVVGGWDFIGVNSTYPDGPLIPGPDPIDQDGHGTHVAGIIAAQGAHITGVAPEVHLRVYKVMGASGYTTSDIMVAAFLRAFQEGVDVITCSIDSSGGGFPNDPIADVVERITQNGVVVTMTVGNSGDIGPMSLGSGIAPDSLGVGCVQPEFLPGQGAVLNLPTKGQPTELIGYFGQNGEQFPSSITNWPVYLVSSNLDDDAQACSPLPAHTPNLTDYVVFVRQSIESCDNTVQQANLEDVGAKFILFYSEEPVTPPQTSLNSMIGTTTTTVAQIILKNARVPGKGVTFTAPDDTSFVGIYPGPVYSGLACSYTGWGPSYLLDVKPDILAPGDNILSTYLNNSYAVMSGTSMSTPYVAGVAALYLSQNPLKRGENVEQFNTKVITSGQSVTWSNNPTFSPQPGLTAPVAQVGGGIINAVTILEASTSVDTASLALNDTAHFKSSHTITLSNTGLGIVIYKLSHEPAGGFSLFDNFTFWVDTVEATLPSVTAKAQLPNSVILLPWESTKITIKFTPPSPGRVNATSIPVYSGKILIEGSNGDSLGIPYIGVAADLGSDLDVFASWAPTAFPTILLAESTSLTGPGRAPQSSPDKYEFFESLFQANLPAMVAPLNYGTAELRWDIFTSEWDQKTFTYPPVVGKNEYVGAATASTQSFGNSGHNSPIAYNLTQPFPLLNVPRNDPISNTGWIYNWVGNLANGSLIANGQYFQRLAALKPFGNPKDPESWSVKVSPFIVDRT